MSSDINIQVFDEDPGDFDSCYKLIVIGDSSVGKSSLSIKATKNLFDENYNPTIGFEFFTFFVRIGESNIKLQIWDTCGQEVYRSLIKSFYTNSSLAILVYSITNKNSFDSLESWINEIKTFGNPDINIFLIGNKVDLEGKREISKEIGEDFCKSHNIKLFLETSAKTGFNAKNIFIEAAKLLFKQNLEYKDMASRPDSINNLNGRETVNKNIMLETNGETEEEGKSRKKKCC